MLTIKYLIRNIVILLIIIVFCTVLIFIGNKFLWAADLVDKTNTFYLYYASLFDCAIVSVLCFPAGFVFFFCSKYLNVKTFQGKLLKSVCSFSVVIFYFTVTSSYGKGSLDLFVIKNILLVFFTSLLLAFLDEKLPGIKYSNRTQET